MAKTLYGETLTVAYGRNPPVLRDVSLRVVPGTVLAVTGPSGAGKTTLLWTLAGLLRPISGQVRIGDARLRDREHAAAERIVLVPQDNGLAPILTAAENISVALLAAGARASQTRQMTEQSLELVGLSGQGDQMVEELSGGQQQRTAMARGLALRGEVLLADEVTSELDAQNRERVVELLLAEARRGAAVVFATHDPDAAAACHAEIHLRDGVGELVR